MTSPRRAIGIDLGTTHVALASIELTEDERPRELPRGEVFSVPQLVDRASLGRSALLPSFLYLPPEGEGALPLPWDEQRRYAVGEYARLRAREVPTRVVSSAKSWLSHTGIDRRAALLPMGAPADVEKVSPVEAAFRYLDHLSEAWQAEHPQHGSALTEHQIVLTVPASFDAAARELTVEAAYCAGFEHVTLLEEPQAALYAFIESRGAKFSAELEVGDVVLVIDVGGGTTDFSAIAVGEEDGQLTLTRVAVGDHILLGGDNMDLALAHRVATRLKAEGHSLDRWQLLSLAHGSRAAKEQLLSGEDAPHEVPLVIPSRGSALIGGTVRATLTREDVESIVLEGFFPAVDESSRPAERARTALTQMGLPYASDPAVTKHLAAFLGRQAHAAGDTGDTRDASEFLKPTAILFNGGVLKAPAIRERVVATLNRWLEASGAPPARVLSGDDPNLAVARGAAYYARVEQGQGLRVRGGTAQAYYVGVESPMPAVPGMEPPLEAWCVAPLGIEEGAPAATLEHELGVVVGHPVEFRFFCSSVRRDDQVGTVLEDAEHPDLIELAPIRIAFPAEGRSPGDVVPVRLRAHVNPVGVLEIEAVPLHPRAVGEAYRVELSVRD